MKQMLRKRDIWVFLAALIGAFACMTLIQFISGRIDGVASMVFLLAVFFVSMYTDGYWWGVAASIISVLAVNFAFRTPYFAFNFTIPENIFSGVVMLVVSFMTSTLTTRIKKQEQLRMESETEKMRANLLRAVSHDLRTPLTSIYGACSTVIDNGCGIPKEQLKRLFSGTTLAQDTSSSGRHGMGIGLSVCAAIIKAHGGEIKAESTPGEGTTIRFWLETEEVDTEETEDEQ